MTVISLPKWFFTGEIITLNNDWGRKYSRSMVNSSRPLRARDYKIRRRRGCGGRIGGLKVRGEAERSSLVSSSRDRAAAEALPMHKRETLI